ncbi:MAG: hypothetical protein VX617_07935 [Pseudomonadota bacterium]|nr:hypothetical protein [Pseudomonadota bacterium]
MKADLGCQRCIRAAAQVAGRMEDKAGDSAEDRVKDRVEDKAEDLPQFGRPLLRTAVASAEDNHGRNRADSNGGVPAQELVEVASLLVVVVNHQAHNEHVHYYAIFQAVLDTEAMYAHNWSNAQSVPRDQSLFHQPYTISNSLGS